MENLLSAMVATSRQYDDNSFYLPIELQQIVREYATGDSLASLGVSIESDEEDSRFTMLFKKPLPSDTRSQYDADRRNSVFPTDETYMRITTYELHSGPQPGRYFSVLIRCRVNLDRQARYEVKTNTFKMAAEHDEQGKPVFELFTDSRRKRNKRMLPYQQDLINIYLPFVNNFYEDSLRQW